MRVTKQQKNDAVAYYHPALALIESLQHESMEREAARRREEQIDAALSRVPPRFQNKTFADFHATGAQVQVKKTLECFALSFPKRLSEGNNLIFIGKPGTGKTLLALILYLYLVQAGYTAQYQPSLHFLRKLQEKQYESHALFEQAMREYQTLSFLIIDEVTEGCGKQAFPADWERHLLRQLIDIRYQAKRPTLIISNRTKSELIERLGEPTVDRLQENSAMLAFDWPSYRTNKS